jgi:hypothetical protein
MRVVEGSPKNLSYRVGGLTVDVTVVPSWRDKWVGFHGAAVFRQTLIQSV